MIVVWPMPSGLHRPPSSVVELTIDDLSAGTRELRRVVESVCGKQIAGAKRKEAQPDFGREFGEKARRGSTSCGSLQPRSIASLCKHEQRVSLSHKQYV